jgi:hypothetical protein
MSRDALKRHKQGNKIGLKLILLLYWKIVGGFQKHYKTNSFKKIVGNLNL